MAAAMKSIMSLAVLVLVLVAQSQLIEAQTCSSALTSLNVCAPYVVPGAANTPPSADCCAALQGVGHDCLCSTMRIAARIPAQCNLPTLNCAAN